jgi:hypothetical protein
MSYFVLEHDRLTGSNVVETVYDGDEAVAKLNQKERDRLPHIEVVLLYATSLDQIKQTHSRYFQSPESLIESLKQQLASSAAPAL